MQALLQASGESVQLYVREDEARRCGVAAVAARAAVDRPRGQPAATRRRLGRRALGGEPVGPGGWIDSVEQRRPGVASVSAPCSTERVVSSPRSA
ncbi:MAG: hypothetical protein R2713_05390 [Ilumatobacteraceae bacterium]